MALDETNESVNITDRDIVFDCPHCNGELVVDKAGAGMVFDCSHCGKPVTVPVNQEREIQNSMPALDARSAPVPGEAGQIDAGTQVQVSKNVYDFSQRSVEDVEKRLNELKFQYKENSSQRTEMRGHINRAQIELHRYQIKLQKLVDRQLDMEAEIRSAQARLSDSN